MTTPDAEGTALPPDREDAVRRLLGSVGDAPALPPDVAARLDDTLAELVADRARGSEQLAPVVVLSARRRRTVAALFVAAAAVVVAGIGIPLAHDGSSDRPTASSDEALTRAPGDTASRGADAAQAPLAGERRPTTTAGLPMVKEAHSGGYAAAGQAATALNDASVRQRLRARLLALRDEVPPDATYTQRTVHARSGFTCAPADFGRGYLLGVRYAGAPAVVAFRAPVGSTQVAEVLQCGTAQVLRSVTLPTR